MYIWGMETMMEKNFQEWRAQKRYTSLQQKKGTLGFKIKEILIRHSFVSPSNK